MRSIRVNVKCTTACNLKYITWNFTHILWLMRNKWLSTVVGEQQEKNNKQTNKQKQKDKFEYYNEPNVR